MFYLIGTGLKPKHISLEALEAIKKCDKVYMESYTSGFSESNIEELEKLIGKKIILLTRSEVEGQKAIKIIEDSKKKDIALLVIGNPLSATTHVQLLIEAKKQNAKTKVIAGISIFNFIGKTGLSEYRFGRVASIVFHSKVYRPESFYDIIAENKKACMHTLCLLDIIEMKNRIRMMNVKEAIEILEKIEAKRKTKVIKNSLLCAVSKAGSKKERIVFGRAAKLKRAKIESPACLIVCAELNEKEKEAIGVLHGYKGRA
ncbi:MAG: diphthine synthase [Candidatus Diapherotrites archaeon]|nr:diphthine synthase [Candidatus Diapherotrites archaeon]